MFNFSFVILGIFYLLAGKMGLTGTEKFYVDFQNKFCRLSKLCVAKEK